MTAPHPILARLDDARRRQGLTFPQLAALMPGGWSHQAIAAWMRGYRQPTISSVEMVAAALGMDVVVVTAGTDVDALHSRVADLEAELAAMHAFVARRAAAENPAVVSSLRVVA